METSTHPRQINVITISRQLGSLGNEVAHRSGELLGFRVVCREVINQAAIRSGAPEVALATIDELNLLGIRPSPQAQKAYQRAVKTVMEELADQRNIIIVGRAGQVVLHSHPNAFHIRVIAPVHLRSHRIAAENECSLAAAQAQIEASDRSRKTYLRRHYHVHWDDPQLYDLVINTARLTPDEAAGLISQVSLKAIPEIDVHARE
jgi:CMP/dCMP kinase